MLQVKSWWQEPEWGRPRPMNYPDLRATRSWRRLRVNQADRKRLELGQDRIYIYLGESSALQVGQ